MDMSEFYRVYNHLQVW